MTKLVVQFLLLFIVSAANAQLDPTNLSGVINKYYKVLHVDQARDYVVVQDSTGLGLYQQVMLIQMKGAAINTANSSSYGAVTAYNNAGKYELNIICKFQEGLTNDTIFLQKDILANYDVNSSVQLVAIAEFTVNATVTGQLQAQAWDSTTGTGGVLAIMAYDLVMNANITASGKGYKGGNAAIDPNSGGCGPGIPFNNGYVFNTIYGGGKKGEGVFRHLDDNVFGRGTPANGGGGGNNHNNGGSGGSNLKSGGGGGKNSSTVGCSGSFYGYAASGALGLDSTGRRIFMGGGGGAAHENNVNLGTNGGRGGGIVFIQAANIQPNGFTISANGENGGDDLSDGASAGGAGGTIIIDPTSPFINTIQLEVKGGFGGNSESSSIQPGRCYGPGGGGSGGVVYYSSASTYGANINTNGGAAGINTGPIACSASAAAAGTNGITTTNYNLSRSATAASYCQDLLPLTLLQFTGKRQNQTIALQWQVVENAEKFTFEIERSNNGNSWVRIGIMNGTATKNYSFVDAMPLNGMNLYRLKIVNKVGLKTSSNIVVVQMNDVADVLVFPNPTKQMLNIVGNVKECKLYTTSGAFVKQFKLKESLLHQTILLPNLTAGLYIADIDGKKIKIFITN
jgi:hypothetical protein